MPPVVSLLIGLADGINTLINGSILNVEYDTFVSIAVGTNSLNSLFHIGTGLMIGGGLYAAIKYFDIKFDLKKIFLKYSGEKDGKNIEGNKEYQKSSPIMKNNLNDGELTLPNITLTPYQIISNKNEIFSVNIFKKDSNNNDSIISNFRKIVRDWYATLRTIAIVGMMSVLIYIGIRIVISSTADSKAKYKQMLWDWLIAACLIFVMHYIMIFTNLLVDSFSDLIDSIHVEVDGKKTNATTYVNEKGVEGFLIGAKKNEKGEYEIDESSSDLIKAAYQALAKKSADAGGSTEVNNNEYYFLKDLNGTKASDENDAKILFWPADDFIVQSRMYAQKSKKEDGLSGNFQYVGFGITYVVLTAYVAVFCWVYIKRLIYMIFLTLISPLVALTYPIDKVKDGQAQAFNFWFREYMYNLLLQPLHMLLYMLLIGSAMQFATENPIYVIVSLGFMVPAEKLIKAMFGFKGQTPGSMPGVAAGALMMHATRKLFGNPPKQPGESANNNGGGKEPKIDDGAPGATQRVKGFNSDVFKTGSSEEKSQESNGGEDEELDETGQAWMDLINNNSEEESGGSSGGSSGESSGGSSGGSPGGSSGGSSRELLGVSREGTPIRNKRTISGPRKLVKTIGESRLGAAARVAGKSIWSNKGKAAKKIAATAAGVTLGGALAGVGGVAAIVGGDPSKAREYMALGGLAGYKFGAGGTESLINGAKSGLNTINNINNAIDKEYYAGRPDEYAEKQQKEYIKNWKDDQKKMDALRLNLGNEKTNQMKNDGTIDYLIEHGFTDPNDIITAQKMVDDDDKDRKVSVKNLDEAMSVLKVNKEIAGGKFNDLNPDDQDKWRRALKERFLKTGNAQNEKQAIAMAKNAEYLMDFANEKRKEIR